MMLAHSLDPEAPRWPAPPSIIMPQVGVRVTQKEL